MVTITLRWLSYQFAITINAIHDAVNMFQGWSFELRRSRGICATKPARWWRASAHPALWVEGAELAADRHQ
jgi:hypothetical protein